MSRRGEDVRCEGVREARSDNVTTTSPLQTARPPSPNTYCSKIRLGTRRSSEWFCLKERTCQLLIFLSDLKTCHVQVLISLWEGGIPEGAGVNRYKYFLFIICPELQIYVPARSFYKYVVFSIPDLGRKSSRPFNILCNPEYAILVAGRIMYYLMFYKYVIEWYLGLSCPLLSPTGQFLIL